MLETLETVFAAVASKDIVVILTHVLIHDGRIQGGDGTMTIDAPYECGVPNCSVPGQKFLNSVKACKGTPKLSITPTGKLSVKQGSFKALLATLPAEDFPVDSPKGTEVPVPKDLLKAVKRLQPFISKDASRPWSMGILFKDGFAYATNNVVLARVPLDWKHVPVVLPKISIDGLVELKEHPTSMFVEEGFSVSFTYNDSMWMKSQLQNSAWPDVGKMLASLDGPEHKVPANMLDAVQRCKKFCTNVKFPAIKISAEGISSDDGGGDIASFEGFELHDGVYNGDMLELVLTNATHIDFGNYPKPCTFSGDDELFGLFVGMVMQ
jgi:hypothetical protein